MPGESQQAPASPPDPTVYAMEAIARAVDAERDFVLGQVAVLVEKINVLVQRMDGTDKATEVLHETVTRTPTDIQQALGHLDGLMTEKFASVNTRFTLNDDRQKSESIANEVKVNAAFAAQKEAAAEQNKSNTTAINKSEDSTKEAINKNSDAAAAANVALSDKLDDLKDRLVRAEDRLSRQEALGIGRKDQQTEQRAVVVEQRDTSRFAMTVLGSVIGAIVFALTIYAAITAAGQ